MKAGSRRRWSRPGLVVGLVSGIGTLVVADVAVDENLQILASTTSRITLCATTDTRTPGRYGLWFSGDSGHARIGAKLSENGSTVTRQLLAVDFGNPDRAV